MRGPIAPLTVLLVLLPLASGCDSGKGSEDDPLTDGKSDSFFNPTHHGELTFGVRHDAEITDDERFHAWTFELDGPATFSIRTEISGSLDTVMYLYRRDLGSSGSFGRFIEKNDDFEGELFSRIDFEGDSGEYRIIVKGFKQIHRGPFAVIGECSGDGCPKPRECEAREFGELPSASSALTEACATDLLAILTAPVGASNKIVISEDDVCELGDFAKVGVDQYRSYWEDVLGWEELKGGTEVGLEVEVIARVVGTEVSVETDIFDEDLMTLLYNDDGDLVFLVQHNQSPDRIAFCNDIGPISPPDEFCAEEMLLAFTHRADAEETGSLVTSCEDSLDDDLPFLVGEPVCEFSLGNGIADDAPVAVSFRTWRAVSGLLGAEVTYEAGGKTDTFFVGTTFSDTMKIFATTSRFGFHCFEL